MNVQLKPAVGINVLEMKAKIDNLESYLGATINHVNHLSRILDEVVKALVKTKLLEPNQEETNEHGNAENPDPSLPQGEVSQPDEQRLRQQSPEECGA